MSEATLYACVLYAMKEAPQQTLHEAKNTHGFHVLTMVDSIDN